MISPPLIQKIQKIGTILICCSCITGGTLLGVGCTAVVAPPYISTAPHHHAIVGGPVLYRHYPHHVYHRPYYRWHRGAYHHRHRHHYRPHHHRHHPHHPHHQGGGSKGHR